MKHLLMIRNLTHILREHCAYIVVFVVLIVLCISVNADEIERKGVVSTDAVTRDFITIGSGTSTQRQPFGMFFGYERSASLYTASEMMYSGLITDMGWYKSSTGTVYCPNVKIYLKMTTDTSLTATTWSSMISGATTVLNGTPTYFSVNGWFVFDTTDFIYSNNQNLLVMVETNYGGTGTSTYPQFRYSSSTSKHQYWAADGSAPTGNGTVNDNRPNLIFSMTLSPKFTP